MKLLSRRAFGRLAALSLAAARARAEEFHLNIGVGTFSYHLLSLDGMIVQLQANRIREIEMSRGEFMLMTPPAPQTVESARRKLDAAGIRCVSYYTATIKNAQDLDLAIRYARIFGAANVSGDATGPMLHEIDRRFTAEGLTFGIHNHWFPQKFPFESAEDVLRALSDLSPTVGSTLDVGQMAACGHDPVDALRRLQSRLKLVHLKDVAAAGAEHNVLFGTGVARIPDVIAELRSMRFSHLIAIEYEKDTNDDEDMRRQITYARKLA